jgi:hypothetical protein
MEAMLAKLDEVEAKVEEVSSGWDGKVQALIAQIAAFDEGVVDEILTVKPEINQLLSDVQAQVYSIENKVNEMLPPS